MNINTVAILLNFPNLEIPAEFLLNVLLHVEHRGGYVSLPRLPPHRRRSNFDPDREFHTE